MTSALEVTTGWAVRAVNLAVAIHAGATDEVSAWGTGKPTLPARDIGTGRRCAGMRAVVTLLAHEWGTGKQQRRNIGAVRRVAIHATLYRGPVLEQEGSAFLRMTHIARFVYAVLDEHLGPSRAMGVVAIGADDLAYSNWVCRNFVTVRTLLFMAGEANLGLGLLISNGVDGLMGFVAVVAGNAIDLMLTAVPVSALLPLMAGEALAGTLFVI